MASVFGCPTVETVAGACRLMLDVVTQSASISVMWRSPVRTSASAAQLPTPPMPNTATLTCESIRMASSPSIRSERLNMESLAWAVGFVDILAGGVDGNEKVVACGSECFCKSKKKGLTLHEINRSDFGHLLRGA